MTTNELLETHYFGKTLISSNFHSEGDTIYDCMDNELEDFSPFGKKIVAIGLGTNSSREDAGILITVEGYSDPFFFYSNESLEVA
jgi:hypothetical protein